MRSLSFVALFGVALAARTGPLRPRQSPPPTLPSSSLPTLPLVTCVYFDGATCYYDYVTGAGYVVPAPCPPTAVCVPHSQPIICTSYGCPTIPGTTYLDAELYGLGGVDVWDCDYLYIGSQTDTVSCGYFTTMNGQVYTTFGARPGGASECPARITCT
ncbi:hypothetical protein CALCODRAFT_504214 [Calocera cornea HHB12733]|uniref:Uncharacterized protein n=1 Tax=Calocera cornea HHB12733 TaxID=1353952 RepID=A0A165CIY9_9BASI|nr:hypothetical protein CALCODRAFT_504214 [Calocera cornea HHB12733]